MLRSIVNLRLLPSLSTGESLEGAATIRAFRAQPQFVKDNEGRVDYNLQVCVQIIFNLYNIYVCVVVLYM